MDYITPPCFGCGKATALSLDADKVGRWKAGALIQEVWPEKTPAERELLITGTHPACWDALIGDEDDA